MKVFVLDPINAKGIDLLRKKAEVILWDDPAAGRWRDDADGVIVRGTTPLAAADFASAARLKAVSKHGTGVDRIDLEAARRNGVRVMNTPGLNAEAVAEMSMAMALAAARRVPMIDRLLRSGQRIAREDFDGSRAGGAQGFWGKTVGVLGMGAIGRRVAAKWSAAFGMNVLWFDPFVPEAAGGDLEGERIEDIDQMLGRVDLLSIHAPLTKETKGMIGAREIGLMKNSAVLVSLARGGIVDERALFDALSNGLLFGAALDVFEQEPPPADHPLFSIPSFVGTPHIAAGTVDSREHTSIAVAEQLLDVLGGGEGKNILV
ncbi:MAG: D-3-phosphoglycerate dehydrogenase [Rhodospirillales bacterium]|jgi:D-3-phosphoglycerate dehydrogenase / 2-oxoglutarate reductase|nr:D-3-phosphoglycerate dehydrogenase [Rhodospirillales bacterium]